MKWFEKILLKYIKDAITAGLDNLYGGNLLPKIQSTYFQFESRISFCLRSKLLLSFKYSLFSLKSLFLRSDLMRLALIISPACFILHAHKLALCSDQNCSQVSSLLANSFCSLSD
ncbi:hypothetical protein AMECASPLE_020428 [Ameca splendens]|uniref:Uncharacterized protein n=1 Tax=Ameca splendens TaxID=208324 RepID=A0ABV0YEP0_9TELE